MKKFKTFCAAVMLTLLLTLPVFAGEMTTMIVDPPPPPPSSVVTEGQKGTGGSEASDPVTEIVLSLLQSVMPLF